MIDKLANGLRDWVRTHPWAMLGLFAAQAAAWVAAGWFAHG